MSVSHSARKLIFTAERPVLDTLSVSHTNQQNVVLRVWRLTFSEMTRVQIHINASSSSGASFTKTDFECVIDETKG